MNYSESKQFIILLSLYSFYCVINVELIFPLYCCTSCRNEVVVAFVVVATWQS